MGLSRRKAFPREWGRAVTCFSNWRSRGQGAILIALAFLYIAFLSVDFFGCAAQALSGKLKYCAMLLVFALCALSLPSAYDKREGLLLLSALAITLIADYLLLFTRRYAMGVGVFCFAQALHAGRLCNKPPLLVAAAAMISAALFGGRRGLYIAAGLYAALFFRAFALSLHAKGAGAVRLRWGYILFLLCDIHVALYHVLGAGAHYAPTAQRLIWLFYLPSQALIALSAGARVYPSNVNRV